MRMLGPELCRRVRASHYKRRGGWQCLHPVPALRAATLCSDPLRPDRRPPLAGMFPSQVSGPQSGPAQTRISTAPRPKLVSPGHPAWERRYGAIVAQAEERCGKNGGIFFGRGNFEQGAYLHCTFSTKNWSGWSFTSPQHHFFKLRRCQMPLTIQS